MILAYLCLFVCYLQDAGDTEGAEFVIWFSHSHSCTCFPDWVHLHHSDFLRLCHYYLNCQESMERI